MVGLLNDQIPTHLKPGLLFEENSSWKTDVHYIWESAVPCPSADGDIFSYN